MTRTLKLSGVLLLLTSGCALLGKQDPVVPKYYTPETIDAPGEATQPSGLTLRLGRIGGGSYLKERIAYRASDHEFGFYEDRRWTERPEVYLQRALERSIYETHGIRRDLDFSAPTLTADLIEFEEVKGKSPHVRLRVSYALHDERTVYRESSFAIEHPVASGPEDSETDRVAASLGEALHEAAERISGEVITDLRTHVTAAAAANADAGAPP